MSQWSHLAVGFSGLTVGNVVMFAVGAILIYLAVKKEYEPMLLLPIGFGAILVNIPFSAATGEHGILTLLYNTGIATELFPILIFVGVGAMIDFEPLLQQPMMLLFGAAAQFGVFATMVVAAMLGFDLKEAASIGIIGAADGPTSIYVATRFAPHFLGPISVAAYSYMSLVPIIQPPIIRLLTTRNERRIRMEYKHIRISKTVKILFPIVVTLVAGMLAPISVPLIGFLMFGNLLRECGVVDRLSKAAQNELASLVTLLLGITIGSTMGAEFFLKPETLMILGMGIVAFAFDTAGGVVLAKFMNLFLKHKINPMVGASGISAFPMSARVVESMGTNEDPTNHLIMQAAGANFAGQISSIIAGGMVLALIK